MGHIAPCINLLANVIADRVGMLVRIHLNEMPFKNWIFLLGRPTNWQSAIIDHGDQHLLKRGEGEIEERMKDDKGRKKSERDGGGSKREREGGNVKGEHTVEQILMSQTLQILQGRIICQGSKYLTKIKGSDMIWGKKKNKQKKNNKNKKQQKSYTSGQKSAEIVWKNWVFFFFFFRR